jgi:hypothetical protein
MRTHCFGIFLPLLIRDKKETMIMKSTRSSLIIFICSGIVNLLIIVFAMIKNRHIQNNIQYMTFLFMLIGLGIIGLYNLFRIANRNRGLNGKRIFLISALYIICGLFILSLSQISHLILKISFPFFLIIGFITLCSGIITLIVEIWNLKIQNSHARKDRNM